MRQCCALEMHCTKAEPVPAASLGHALIAYQLHMPFLVWEGSHKYTHWEDQQRALHASRYSANDFERHQALNIFFRAPLIDRTATLDNGLKMKILHAIPTLDKCFSHTVDDLCRSRSLELLRRHKRIKLLWSGGIDSTTVMVAFLRNAPPEAWNEQLSVHYCLRSVDENPTFFKQHVSKLPQHEVIEGHVRDFVFASHEGTRASAEVLVTGDPGDILFGGMLNAREIALQAEECKATLQGDWHTVMPELMRSQGLLANGERAQADWCAWIGAQVEKSPIPVHTALDFIWWVNFSCKLQTDVLHLFFNQSAVSSAMIESVEHFFLSDDWQQWALHNQKDATTTLHCSEAGHKLPLKKYIYG